MCINTLRKLKREYRDFWNDKENEYECRKNDTWLTYKLGRLFTIFNKLSCSRFKVWHLEHIKCFINWKLYKFVDLYVLGWLLSEIILFILLACFDQWSYRCIFWIPLIFIFYRLFEIFQSWFSQFILGGVPNKWSPTNLNRSLVLVFLNYIEIVISYAIIALFSKYNFVNDEFQNIISWQQSLEHSIRNAVAMGSEYHPANFIGWAIFITQICFAILFLTAIVNKIVSSNKSLP